MIAARSGVLVGGVLVSSLVIVPALPASAQVDPISVEVVGGGTLFDTDGIYPGFRMTDEIRIGNSSGDTGAIRLRIVDLVSDDRGCNDPESRVDATCGDGEGELAEQVLLGIDRIDAGRDVAVLPPTRLETIGDVPMGRIAAGATGSYRLTWELPVSSGNETQTDRVGFDLEIAGFSLAGAGPNPLDDRLPAAPDQLPTVDVDPDVVTSDPVITGPGATDPAPIGSTDGPVVSTPLGGRELQVLGSTTSKLPRTGGDHLGLWSAGLAGVGAGGVLVGLAKVRRRVGAR